MKLAVTYENGQIFQHFGHTEQFKVYDIEDNKIVNTQVVDTNGPVSYTHLDVYKRQDPRHSAVRCIAGKQFLLRTQT